MLTYKVEPVPTGGNRYMDWWLVEIDEAGVRFAIAAFQNRETAELVAGLLKDNNGSNS